MSCKTQIYFLKINMTIISKPHAQLHMASTVLKNQLFKMFPRFKFDLDVKKVKVNLGSSFIQIYQVSR